MWDLTQPITEQMSTYPGDPPVRVTPTATVERDGYAVRRLELGSHTGTHVDAPAHVFADGRTLAEYEPARFVFDARLVDCTELGAREAIGPARVPDGSADCVVFRTGWDAHWGTDRYADHPYLSPAAARRCGERGLAVATDTLSPDPTGAGAADEPDGVPAHRAVLGADRPIVENLTNLESLPERFELRVVPLALGGDGAPTRAVGVPH